MLEYELDHGLQFGSYLKLIIKSNCWLFQVENGDNTDILKFQQFKNTDESYFFQNFWMNVCRSLIAYIYSVASTTTAFTPKLAHSLFIPRTRRRNLSCGNRRHSSRIAFVLLFVFVLYNYNLFNNTWFVQWPTTPREADLGAPDLVQFICPEKIQMSNCQLPKYTLQNTKMYNITSYQSIH